MSENHNQTPPSEKKIYSIGLHRIRPMQNHPFSVRDDEEMTALMESIRQYGVLTPITVRATATRRILLKSSAVTAAITLVNG